MKKNKMMRTAAVLGIAALLSTSALSGTLAKYTTSVNSEDSARVATWGFTQSSIDITDLFKDAYDETVKSSVNVIAPGTTGSETFKFVYSGTENAPEVKYNFTVSTKDSTIAEDIKTNKDIVWQLDNGNEGTWDDLLSSIQALAGTSGTKDASKESTTVTYNPNTLPTEFPKAEKEHTITWKWKFNDSSSTENKYWVKNDGTVTTTDPNESTGYTAMTQDQYDTYMGNKAKLDSVKLKITITATQID